MEAVGECCVPGDEVVEVRQDRGFGEGLGAWHAQVVEADVDEDVADAGHVEHIVVETGQEVFADAVGEEPVA